MAIRNRMKAALSAAVCLVILLSTLGLTSAQTTVIKGEPDGQSKMTSMDEHFYSGTLEPNFTSDNVEVVTDSFAMHNAGAYQYGSVLMLRAYKMKAYNRFTFTIDCIRSDSGFIYCGLGGSAEDTFAGSYDANVTFSNNITALYEMGGQDQWKPVGEGYMLPNIYNPGKSTDIALTVQQVSGKDYKVTFEVLDAGEVIASTDYKANIRLEHANGGYFCMWAGLNEVFNIRDFKAYDSPTHLAFSDDFEHSSLTYAVEALGDSKWHVNNGGLEQSDVFLCRNAGPEFKKPNAAITAKKQLQTCDKVSKPYEITANVSIENLSKNATFGFFFGAEKAGEIGKSTVIGVSAYDDKFAAVNIVRNGQLMNAGESQIPLRVLDIGGGMIELKAVIHDDNSVVFSVGGVQVKFYNVKYDGYWGMCTYSSDQKSTADAKVDEIAVVSNTYEDCTSPDRSNDFAGIKMTPDGFEEYYISDRTYYIGPGASLRPKGAFTTDPSMYFENTGPYTAFGPKTKYTDFILNFDVKVVSNGENGQWFGVSFGKTNYASISSTVPGISFACNRWTDTPYTHMATSLCEFDDGTREKKIDDYHFYKDQETKYNIMIVARNRTVYVYFKEDSEDISKLGICRAVIPNVNTAGYVMIYGNGGLAFDIFNFRIVNISGEATGDSAIALRESFDGTSITDKLTTEGAATVQDGTMALSGGSLAMTGNSRYSIANCTVPEMKEDLSLSFANGNSVTLSKDMNKVIVKEGGKSTAIDVSKYNLSDYNKLQLQYTMQYDTLTVSAKGVYDPYDKLSAPIAEYTFARPLNEGVLKWSSKNAKIDDVSVYSLDARYNAESISYE
ncbi:MAG: hypothetical protein MJ132_07220, partial [Clostridia bacterium]|nr:hypothetical protein [Clostridia bacterium]